MADSTFRFSNGIRNAMGMDPMQPQSGPQQSISNQAVSNKVDNELSDPMKHPDTLEDLLRINSMKSKMKKSNPSDSGSLND